MDIIRVGNKSTDLHLEIHKPRFTFSFIIDINRKFIDFNIGFIFFNFTFNKHFNMK